MLPGFIELLLAVGALTKYRGILEIYTVVGESLGMQVLRNFDWTHRARSSVSELFGVRRILRDEIKNVRSLVNWL